MIPPADSDSPQHTPTLEGVVNRAQRLLRQGFARDALALLPEANTQLIPRIEQLRAHALNNTGAPRSARRVLQALVDQGHKDVETLGFLGRTEKELARTSARKEQADNHWRTALRYYLRAFTDTNDPYPGINAATLSLRLGQTTAAHKLARRVISACNTGSSKNPDQAYWNLATLAEANLVLGDIASAKRKYTQVMAQNRADLSAMGSMVRQAREIMLNQGLDPAELADTLAIPKIAVFAGHMVDLAERDEPRFPASALPAASEAIAAMLAEHEVGIGFCALANGGDMLFAEALLERGAELHVVLPMDVEAFEQFSVATAIADAHDWSARYARLLDAATSLTVTSDGINSADIADLRYCNQINLGLAQLKAQELGANLVGIALWNGEDSLPGGTADSIALWQKSAVPVRVSGPTGQRITEPPKPTLLPTPDERPLMSLVFADVVGYSKFTEHEVKTYFQEVLPKVATLLERGNAPAVQQTFGDAFYFAFHELSDAVDLALALQRLFTLPGALPQFSNPVRIRIALHAGPLLPCQDPINNTTNYTGRHTSKAARVEPVAPENQILTTQQFAALAVNLREAPFELVYVGERALPKNYGSERLYLLTTTEAELT